MPSHYLTCGEFLTGSSSMLDGKGLDMKIEFIDFVPDPDALVVLIQAVRCTSGASLQALNADFPSGGSGERDEAIWTSDRWAIDAPGMARWCPAFGMTFGAEGQAWGRWSNALGKGSVGSDGSVGRVVRGREAAPAFLPAMLKDQPSRESRGAGVAFHHQFEVVALRISRDCPLKLSAAVRGVITWGYKLSHDDVPSVDAPVVTRRPSRAWVDAANAWNRRKGARGYIPGDEVAWLS